MDNRVTAYIEKAPDFAKPVLVHLRKLIHKGCPQVTETIKWGMPYFEYKGILCNMAAFKKHCAFGFWKAPLMKDAEMLIANNGKAMGHSGKITSLSDLPPDHIIIERIKEAVKLNEEGVELPRRKSTAGILQMPEILQKVLNRKRNAVARFNELAPSHKKEYINWINEAKTAETKLQRSEKVLEMVEAKSKK